MQSRYLWAAGLLSGMFQLSVSTPSTAAEEVRLNEIQVIGTHNSYHVGLTPAIEKLQESKHPADLINYDYHHRNLDQQLASGIRQIELDVYGDSQGGRFAHPKGIELAAAAGLGTDPLPGPPEIMSKPGFKVLHVRDIDYRSNCLTFVACLKVVRDWSVAHPHHAPIFILVETKVAAPAEDRTETEPFTSKSFDALDAEIRAVFPNNSLITPDQVRGRFPTLEAAVRAKNWPTLRNSQGKVLFLMDQRKMGPAYLEGHPSLRGRILFTNAKPGEPDAAFVEQNENDVASINALVREGYLVRARADSDTKQARTNDTSRRDALLASGAQFISTDYPLSEPSKWTGYSVGFPEKVAARCNPVIAPPSCQSSSIDPYPLEGIP